MAYTTYSSPLLACVQELLRQRPASITLKSLADEMGRTSTWIYSFARGEADGVSARDVEFLYVRLTGKQLVETRELTKTSA
jgi:hypothetical protein